MKLKIADRTLCVKENSFSFKEKIEIARQLEKLCVNTIELPQIENVKTDILLVKTIASFVKNGVISVCTGMNKEGLENAVLALSTAAKPSLRIELPVSTVGMEYICHKKAPKMLEMIKELVALAKEKCADVEFVALDATRAERDELEQFLLAAVESGATTLTLCDSAADIMPDKFASFIKEIRSKIDENIELGVSCNDKNSLAAASAVLATASGATVIKTDIGGEEIELEAMVNIIKNCGNGCGFEADVKYTELSRIIKQIGWVMGNSKNEKGSLAAVSADESEILLDKNDTEETVVNAVLKLGYDLSEEDYKKVYEEFLRVADKKAVGTKELDAIVASVALQVPATYKLVSYVINNGNIISSTAQIALEKDGEMLQGTSIGDGPVDAAVKAIETIIGCHYELDDFQIQSVTEGKQALGSALVKLRQNGKLYSGNGISTDIIGASIKAYISALNKIAYEEAN